MVAKKKDKFRLVPYSAAHEEALLELERMSPQGTMIKMQIMRQQFLSRAVLFDDYAAYSVLGESDQLIAGGIGAQVPMKVQGNLRQTGFGFDMLVHPSYRNLGIGRELARHMSEDFFLKKGLQHQFTILRAGNMPMLHLLSRFYFATYLYQFLYLTFPTARTIRVEETDVSQSQLCVDLLSGQDRLSAYYETTEGGLGLWHTHKVYELKIKSVSPVLSGGLWLGNRLIRTNKYVPNVGAVLKTTTLFNLNKDNIHTLPEVSLQLYQQGINYLQVCCQSNDYVYHALHRSALNSSNHYVVSTEELNTADNLTLDVRCL